MEIVGKSAKGKPSFRFELDEDLSNRFKRKLSKDGYRFTEWAREHVREYLNSDRGGEVGNRRQKDHFV